MLLVILDGRGKGNFEDDAYGVSTCRTLDEVQSQVGGSGKCTGGLVRDVQGAENATGRSIVAGLRLLIGATPGSFSCRLHC